MSKLGVSDNHDTNDSFSIALLQSIFAFIAMFCPSFRCAWEETANQKEEHQIAHPNFNII